LFASGGGPEIDLKRKQAQEHFATERFRPAWPEALAHYWRRARGGEVSTKVKLWN